MAASRPRCIQSDPRDVLLANPSREPFVRLTLFALCLLVTASATAQSVPDTARKSPKKLDTLVAASRVSDLVGIAQSASQGAVGAADLAMRPLLRPGEVVENIPGVIVTQHSGSGKANQYFLRGFNLDHGTDLALRVDGVPVNNPTHAHGQGYADLNFLIPELVERVDFKKGPYYSDAGDFASAGSFDVHYYRRLPTGLFSAQGGPEGFGRLLAADNIGSGNLLYAAEYQHNDGPWLLGDNEQKVNGVLRYGSGDDRRGFSLTAIAYHNQWRSTDQIPERAVANGTIGRFGNVDPTDAGRGGRYSLAADWRAQGTSSTSRAMVYGFRYDLELFSNFTYFLDDPVHGDQIDQQDRRYVVGAVANHSRVGTLFGAVSQNTVGIEVRNDHIDNSLYHSEAQHRLNDGVVNRVVETSLAPYVENRTYWMPWLRSTVGLRADAYWFDVRNVVGGASGQASTALISPKFGLVLGPWSNTEFYANVGYGFHSNDARGVVAATDPATALARSRGAELGARTSAIAGLQSSISFWVLDLKSELRWSGDAGSNEPSGPTRRYGVEVANFYTPVRWLTIDADYAWSHTRYTDNEPNGKYVPEALVSTFDGGVALHNMGGALHRVRADARLRYFGPRPLTQDNSVRSAATSLVYAHLGYTLSSAWDVSVSMFNVLNTHANDIAYFYTSRLQGEPLAGVDGVQSHPAEPRTVRLTISARTTAAHKP